MRAATLLGSQKSSQYAAGYFTTGATEWTRETLILGVHPEGSRTRGVNPYFETVLGGRSSEAQPSELTMSLVRIKPRNQALLNICLACSILMRRGMMACGRKLSDVESAQGGGESTD
jgi:hypothetical protein